MKSQELKRSRRSFEVDDAHALVEHRQDCAHQVLGVWQVLDLLPLSLFIVSLRLLLACLSFVFDSCLYSGNFLVSLGFALFDFFDEVVRLGDCTVRVDLHNVHVHVFWLVDRLAGDDVSDINNAFITIISVVVEENMLRDVVALVDHQQLCIAVASAWLRPRRIVLLDCHAAVLLKSLQDCLEDV